MGKIRLYQPLQNGNKYCGPSAVSILTGIGTREAAAMMRQYDPNKPRIKGSSFHHVNAALLSSGLRLQPLQSIQKEGRSTLYRWASAHRDGKTYLVNSGKHWVVVQSGHAICGWCKDLLPARDHPFARTFVRQYTEVVRGEKDDLYVPPPKAKPTVRRPRAPRTWKELRAKAEELGLVIEQDFSDLWFIAPADDSREDPIEDGHYANTLSEACDIVAIYEKAWGGE